MTRYLSGLAFRSIIGKQLCLNHFPLLISIRKETHYDVLKLPRSCSSKEVREAFITLSKENHPDKNQNDPSMHTRFVKINEAYRTLIKPSSRHAYDVSLNLKRKLSPPQYNTTKHSEEWAKSAEPEFKRAHHQDFKDPFMWNNAKNTQETGDNYYGIKGVKRVSNTVIVWLIFAFSLFGVLIQVAIIRATATKRNEYMMQESRKNSLLESMLREKAKLYGNEHQIQILKNSLKATYTFDNDNPDEDNESTAINADDS